jgi:hypothetical protein
MASTYLPTGLFIPTLLVLRQEISLTMAKTFGCSELSRREMNLAFGALTLAVVQVSLPNGWNGVESQHTTCFGATSVFTPTLTCDGPGMIGRWLIGPMMTDPSHHCHTIAVLTPWHRSRLNYSCLPNFHKMTIVPFRQRMWPLFSLFLNLIHSRTPF